MRPRMRIQAKPRWQTDEEEPRVYTPPEPVPAAYKYVAAVGILLFWAYFLGWLGRGGADGLETGFWLFGICQLPLLWRWLRTQMNRWR